MFVIGQIVGELDGENTVQIRIDKINDDNSIIATVVNLGKFYSTYRAGMEDGFILGETLLFEFKKDDNHSWWIIKEPHGRPWHVLGYGSNMIANGGPYFEHYR